MKDYMRQFSRHPQVVNGQTVFTGTRVLVSTILHSLAEGDSIDQLLRSFPSLTREHIMATIAYAADVARDLGPMPPVQTAA